MLCLELLRQYLDMVIGLLSIVHCPLSTSSLRWFIRVRIVSGSLFLVSLLQCKTMPQISRYSSSKSRTLPNISRYVFICSLRLSKSYLDPSLIIPHLSSHASYLLSCQQLKMSSFLNPYNIPRPASRVGVAYVLHSLTIEALHQEHANKPILPFNPADQDNLTIGEDGVIRFACEKEEVPLTSTTPQPLISAPQPSTWDHTQPRPASRNEGPRSNVVAALHQESADKPFLPYNPADPENLTIGEDGIIRFSYEEEIPTASTAAPLLPFQSPAPIRSTSRPASRNGESRSDVISALHQECAIKPLLPYSPADPNNLTIEEDGIIRFAHEQMASPTDDAPQPLSSSYKSLSSTQSISRPASRNEKFFTNVVLALQEEHANKPLLPFNPTNPNNLTIGEDGIIRFASAEETSPTGTVFDSDETSIANHSSDTSLSSPDEDQSTDDKSQKEFQVYDNPVPQAELLITTIPSEKDNEDFPANIEVAPTENTNESSEECIDSTESTTLDRALSLQVILQQVPSDSLPEPVNQINHILDDPAISLVQAPFSSVELDEEEIEEDEHFQQLIYNLRITAPKNVDTSFLDAPFEYHESLLQDLQELKTSTWHGQTDIFMDPAVILVGKPQSVEKWDNNDNCEARAAHFAELLNGLKHSAANQESPMLTMSDTAIEGNFDIFLQKFAISAVKGIPPIFWSTDKAALMTLRTQSADQVTVSDTEKEAVTQSQPVDESCDDEDRVIEKAQFVDLLLDPKQNATLQESSTHSPSSELYKTALQAQSPQEATTSNTKQNLADEEPIVEVKNDKNPPVKKSRFANFLRELKPDAADDKTPEPIQQTQSIDTPTLSSTEQKIAEEQSVEKPDNDEGPSNTKSRFANFLWELNCSAIDSELPETRSSNETDRAMTQAQPSNEVVVPIVKQKTAVEQLTQRSNKAKKPRTTKSRFAEFLHELEHDAGDDKPSESYTNNGTASVISPAPSSDIPAISTIEQNIEEPQPVESTNDGGLVAEKVHFADLLLGLKLSSVGNNPSLTGSRETILSTIAEIESFDNSTIETVQTDPEPEVAKEQDSIGGRVAEKAHFAELLRGLRDSATNETSDPHLSNEIPVTASHDRSSNTPTMSSEEQKTRDINSPISASSTDEPNTPQLQPNSPIPTIPSENAANPVPIQQKIQQYLSGLRCSDEEFERQTFGRWQDPNPSLSSSSSSTAPSTASGTETSNIPFLKPGSLMNIFWDVASRFEPELLDNPIPLEARQEDHSMHRAVWPLEDDFDCPLFGYSIRTVHNLETIKHSQRKASNTSCSCSFGTPHYAQHTLSSQAKVVDSSKASKTQHPRVTDLKGSRGCSKSPSPTAG